MKAAFRTKYGSPEVLTIKEVDTPVPGEKEVLVRVYATTVSRTDCGVLEGRPWVLRIFTGLFQPNLSVTGTDFAGKVEAVGKGVASFKVGDRVWGFKDTGLGSHAEFLVISEKDPVTTIPEGISYEQAAASAEGAHYAYSFIRRAGIRAGHRVLVYGATGAIGSAAVQLLKHFGTVVTAVANTRNLEVVKALGADKVVDYETQDFTQDDQKYDFVFDAVGKSNFGMCKPLLREGGIYLSSELGPGKENVYLPLTTRWSSKRVLFPVPINIKSSLLLMRELLEKRKFFPVMDKTYPLNQLAEAFRYADSGQKTGNVILSLEVRPSAERSEPGDPAP